MPREIKCLSDSNDVLKSAYNVGLQTSKAASVSIDAFSAA